MGDFLEPAVEIEKSGNPGVFYTDPEKAEKYSALSLGKKGTVLSGFTKHTIQDIGINVKSQSETLQFKSWFGDSKVVDENGKPLEVYHETNWGMLQEAPGDAVFSDKHRGTGKHASPYSVILFFVNYGVSFSSIPEPRIRSA